MENIGLAVLFGAIVIGLFVLWVMGIVKLFQKDYRGLGGLAILGIIVPLVFVVGYAGWFVRPRR